MMIIEMLVSSLIGFLLHQIRPSINMLPRGWRELTSYALGVVGTLPIFVFWDWRVKDYPDNDRRPIVAYILAFVTVGAGVAAGWFFDTLMERDA